MTKLAQNSMTALGVFAAAASFSCVMLGAVGNALTDPEQKTIGEMMSDFPQDVYEGAIIMGMASGIVDMPDKIKEKPGIEI